MTSEVVGSYCISLLVSPLPEVWWHNIKLCVWERESGKQDKTICHMSLVQWQSLLVCIIHWLESHAFFWLNERALGTAVDRKPYSWHTPDSCSKADESVSGQLGREVTGGMMQTAWCWSQVFKDSVEVMDKIIKKMYLCVWVSIC